MRRSEGFRHYDQEIARLQRIPPSSQPAKVEPKTTAQDASRTARPSASENSLLRRDRVDEAARLQQIARMTGLSAPKSNYQTDDKQNLGDGPNFKRWLSGGQQTGGN